MVWEILRFIPWPALHIHIFIMYVNYVHYRTASKRGSDLEPAFGGARRSASPDAARGSTPAAPHRPSPSEPSSWLFSCLKGPKTSFPGRFQAPFAWKTPRERLPGRIHNHQLGLSKARHLRGRIAVRITEPTPGALSTFTKPFGPLSPLGTVPTCSESTLDSLRIQLTSTTTMSSRRT